jgi:hypothetical protein
MFQVPVRILQRRIRQQDLRTVVQVLVQWSGWPELLATWEDLETMRQQFPGVSAWGQADSQGGGNVSDPDPYVTEDEREDVGGSPGRKARPRRERRPPTKLADYVWNQKQTK